MGGGYGSSVAAAAKRFEYAVDVDRAGGLHTDGATPLLPDDDWSPDEFVLAALARCTIKSLRYHANRLGGDAVASASARGVVTKRDEDGRYAFVHVECDIEAELDPEPRLDAVRELLAKAERDCFVGASLTVSPRYRWRVNGKPMA